MDPREFQNLASELVNGRRASEIRTAISRAYYAVYNVGVEILTELGFRISEGPSGHAEVRNRLSNSGESKVVMVGSQLNDFYTRRLHADYRLNRKDVENQKTAQALVELAKMMIRTLDESRSEPKRLQIIKAIQEWELKTSQRS
jgi:uncharacterized protein (UPF0332 family)